MFAKCDKHYPSRSGQTSIATAVTNFTKPVTKINSGPSTHTYREENYGRLLVWRISYLLWLGCSARLCLGFSSSHYIPIIILFPTLPQI